MKLNFDEQVCECCFSEIISYVIDGKFVFECSYCGAIPEHIDFPLCLEEDEENGEDENMQ